MHQQLHSEPAVQHECTVQQHCFLVTLVCLGSIDRLHVVPEPEVCNIWSLYASLKHSKTFLTDKLQGVIVNRQLGYYVFLVLRSTVGTLKANFGRIKIEINGAEAENRS